MTAGGFQDGQRLEEQHFQQAPKTQYGQFSGGGAAANVPAGSNPYEMYEH